MAEKLRPIQDIVTTYWRYFDNAYGSNRNKARAETRWWAVETVQARMSIGGHEAVQLIIALADEAITDERLAYLGAGPIEDLFFLNEANPPIKEFESALRQHLKVCEAFQYSWTSSFPASAIDALTRYQTSSERER